MIPELRRRFLAGYSPERYRAFLALLEERTATPILFRNCETPCFFPRSLLDRMAGYGRELILQLTSDVRYLADAESHAPAEFLAPRCDDRPLFVQADFGLIRDAAGQLQPRLVEIQGFPSLYALQPVLAECYRDAYGLDPELRYLLGGLDRDRYEALLRRALLGDHKPDHVVLLEVFPQQQKTRADFVLTERLCGIRTVCVTEIERDGRKLFYRDGRRRVPVERIYNRAISDEIARLGVTMAFRFSDDLDVEWAGHPNWYFRISKYSLPWLQHPCVPRTQFLDRLDRLPDNLDNWVLKQLYSFAGLGVVVGPVENDIAGIPEAMRGRYVLQERMRFEPVIDTPHGPTQAEVRIMFLWLDELIPTGIIIRMGRGKMMGVDHNRNLEWVGGSAAFFP